jgi:hypothetical protein
MIITDFIMTSVDNIQQYQKIAKDNMLHSFTIISIEDTDNDYKKMIFSFDSARIAYLMTDIFYAGKKAGILQFSNISNETAY